MESLHNCRSGNRHSTMCQTLVAVAWLIRGTISSTGRGLQLPVKRLKEAVDSSELVIGRRFVSPRGPSGCCEESGGQATGACSVGEIARDRGGRSSVYGIVTNVTS